MKRIAGLDIVRAVAILFVISVHFLLNTNFYQMPQKDGYGMIVLSFLRHLLLICVPLFIILTGYLNRNKEPNKEYYKGLKKVLTSYFFIAIICIITRIFYFKEQQSILYWVISPFNFTADGYSWYIEMYIGLYLISPFLNKMYKSLETKKEKELLLLVLIIITSIPSITNGYIIQGIATNIIPDYWINFYPITYYFIGTYIAEYQPKLTMKKSIVYITAVLLVQTAANYIINQNLTFNRNIFGAYHNILTLTLSTLVFITLYNKDIKNNFIKKLISLISIVSLDMYLLSYLVDKSIYQYIKPILTTPKEHLIFMIPTIIVIFTSCLILAYIKKMFFDFIEKKPKKQKTW